MYFGLLVTLACSHYPHAHNLSQYPQAISQLAIELGHLFELLAAQMGHRHKATIQFWQQSWDWERRSFDLSDLRGQSIYLYFSVFNDGQGSPSAMYVDDVGLSWGGKWTIGYMSVRPSI